MNFKKKEKKDKAIRESEKKRDKVYKQQTRINTGLPFNALEIRKIKKTKVALALLLLSKN